MKAQNLITSIAAALLTVATLGAVDYNVPVQPAPAAAAQFPVTYLPAVVVQPTAAEWRAAALYIDHGVGATRSTGSDAARRGGLASEQWGMPYYSFANQFGAIAKE